MNWIRVSDLKIISQNQDIQVQNKPDSLGQLKYEVNSRPGRSPAVPPAYGSALTTYMLTIRQLQEDDSGLYRCQISQQGVSAQNYPYRDGLLIVQRMLNISYLLRCYLVLMSPRSFQAPHKLWFRCRRQLWRQWKAVHSTFRVMRTASPSRTSPGSAEPASPSRTVSSVGRCVIGGSNGDTVSNLNGLFFLYRAAWCLS